MNQQQVSQCVQNQMNQPHQSDFCHNNQQQIPNVNTTNYFHYPTLGNRQSPTFCVPQQMDTNSPPNQNAMDQVRPCMGNATPIFILPNTCIGLPMPQQIPPINQSISPASTCQNYPTQMGPLYSATPPFCCLPSPCFSYPVPVPIYDFQNKQECVNKEKQQHSKTCDYCQKSSQTIPKTHDNVNCCNVFEEHKCSPGEDDTICTKRSCPSAISLQTLASQFLGIQGIISCTATRLLLKKIPGSNITTTVEETMDRVRKSIDQLTKDQLLEESKNAQQINALINLHVTARPLNNVLTILTFIQLKVNSLKALVESKINQKLMENQGFGAESQVPFDEQSLSLKSDAELRELLMALRQKECEERVNVNFAPYNSQRILAENRLNCIQRKIGQVEAEFERRRRRDISTLRVPVKCADQHVHDPSYASVNFNYESHDPFLIQVRSPKRLNLKPHVGSPETTYQRSQEIHATSPSTFVATEESGCSKGQCSYDDDVDEVKKNPEIINEKSTDVILNEKLNSTDTISDSKLVMQLIVMIGNDAKAEMNEKVDERKLSDKVFQKEIRIEQGGDLIKFERET